MSSKRRTAERESQRRVRALRRSIGTDIGRLRTDAPTTIAHLAEVAGLDRSFVGRIEAGLANPSLDTLIALAIALGADLSVRFYPGSGPRLTDRHQARMMETVLRRLAAVWIPHLEVPVSRPSRGVIDAVFERSADRLLVVAEAYSAVARLEQQIRWSAEKAASIESSSLVGLGPAWTVSRLLILRSTATNRELARLFAATLRAAYPAPSRAAVESLIDSRPWPGDAVIWIRIDGDRLELIDGPPRGVPVGR
ncbi:MAG: helix-turn-helix transcriptional regulator [Candidatus Limnocylindrales bacterium]|nr:helix-turn-helix transcriptional regulator [Candidatus Limnocylindrales bacterium]